MIFTAGVGENAVAIRALICQPLELLGIRIDDALNAVPNIGRGIRNISHPNSPVQTLVIPTDEELAIAQQVALVLNS